MGKTSFKEFIEQEKTADLQKRKIDWEGRKEYYLDRVRELRNSVENFLHDFIVSQSIQIKEGLVRIDEDYIGEYEAPVLHIYLYGKHAVLMPTGTNIIGSPGRVDLIGEIDTKRLILADKNDDTPRIFAAFSWSEEEKIRVEQKAEKWASRERDYVWKIMTDPPKICYIELTEDSFLSTLQEVLGG